MKGLKNWMNGRITSTFEDALRPPHKQCSCPPGKFRCTCAANAGVIANKRCTECDNYARDEWIHGQRFCSRHHGAPPTPVGRSCLKCGVVHELMTECWNCHQIFARDDDGRWRHECSDGSRPDRFYDFRCPMDVDVPELGDVLQKLMKISEETS